MNFKLTWHWLGKFKVFWWFLIAIIGSVVVADWIGCRIGVSRAERLPYAGWFLEMLGVLVVFFGIGDKLQLFEKDGLIARTIKILSEFPLFRSDTHVAAGTASIRLGGGRVRARTTMNPPPGANLEERVEFLEQAINKLNEWIGDAKEEAIEGLDKLKETIDSELESLREDIDKIRHQSERALVGQLGWEYAGLVWIMMGLTLATIPDGLLWLLSPIIPYFEGITC